MELSCKEAASYAGFAGEEMQLGSGRRLNRGGGDARCGCRALGGHCREMEMGTGQWLEYESPQNVSLQGLSVFRLHFLLKMFLGPFPQSISFLPCLWLVFISAFPPLQLQ